MRSRTKFLSIVASFLIVFVSAANTMLAPTHVVFAAPALAPDAKCANATLINTIATDLVDIGGTVKTLPDQKANGTYDALIKIVNARLKYEDMTTPADLGCNYLVTETIILFATIGDYGLINMGSKLGLDTSADLPVVTDRLTKQLQKVTDLVGTPTASAATAAAPTPAATAMAPTAKCTNQKLIDAINADLVDIAADMKTIPSTGAGGVYSIAIKTANARLKYEDLEVPTDEGCTYLWTESVILFANIGDLNVLNLGAKLNIDVSADMPTSSARLDAQLKKVNAYVGVNPTS
jgi:hypothetical protein